MKKIIAILISIQCGLIAAAQQTVSQADMQRVYEEVKTPYKYGLVVVPDATHKKVDCPSVYRQGKYWYMTYVVFDGRGYETWLSRSKNLLDWKPLGRIMSFTDSTRWDGHQQAGYIALQDYTWGGSYKWQQYNKQYWLSYFGGKDRGYEAGPLSIGIAHSSKKITKANEFQRLENPVLTHSDPDTRWWENKKLFKSSVIWDKNKTTGYPFVMYYNANGDSSNNTPKWRWFERIGMAGSHDMIKWERIGAGPVVHHKIGITGDGVIQKINNLWVMFYFGAFWENRKNDTFNRFACSYDLVNWTDWNGSDLIKPSEEYDAKYAHKSFVIKHKGVVYHFYNAVDKKDNRGIAVATSVDKGKSKLQFK
jgi:predicted GH43/DUF377 family glycosyl hydrolase